jgi:topoisomerase-4 subunit A
MTASSTKNKIETFVEEKIIHENLENIVGDRFGRYSKYIIQDRALPDVRDGLKPVQRRILYAMDQLGMGSDKPYKKSARIVGEVIGKYHPHGDTSVYDAMVRMSQTWKMGALLIDMHGNNGSIDGDPAAAMRYTEARLSPFAEALLQDIDKKTVNLIPNFDDEEYEPIVLPAKYPNLLVNGAMGMATGYATNIPPHNLNEIIDATIHRIDHPSSSIDDLMEFIQGPDFPTGGIATGIDEIKKAFRTGKGRVVMKSRVEVSDTMLIITEIPYEVNKADLVRKIDEIRLKKKIDGIIEVRDESDREGLRIVIDINKDINSEIVLAYLEKNTELSLSFNYNMVAIDNKSPKQMGLLEILDSYIIHQKEVIRNRSYYDLTKAEKRKHIVEGFLKMVNILDEVIEVIRHSNGKKDSMINLVNNFEFTEFQAEAIVMLQLYRLSSTDVNEMRQEEGDLSRIIAALQKILKNEHELENVIKKELRIFSEKNQIPRRTEIVKNLEKIAISELDLIQHENVMVAITRDGYLKRSSLKSALATSNGDTGLKQDDVIIKQIEVSTKSTMLIFTNLGNYAVLPVYKIPDKKWKEIGEYIGSFVPIKRDETIIDALIIDQFDNTSNVLLANREGAIKQVVLSEFQPARINKTYLAMPCTKINPLVSVDLSGIYDTEIVVVSKNGYVLKFPIDEVSVLGLSARGVKGMNLREDEMVAAMYVTSTSKDEIILLTNRGAVKREFVQNIETGHRPAKGKLYLKSVKTNPYEFVGGSSINMFYLKDYVTLRIELETTSLIIPGDELKPDKYEHGIPYVERDQLPIALRIDEKDPTVIEKILIKLSRERLGNVISDEITIVSSPETDLEEEIEIPSIEDDNSVMWELEKIINTNKNIEDEEEEDNEKVIQQTLF